MHAKDTRIEPRATVDTTYEKRPFQNVEDRAWNYVTLGHGHPGGQQFWDGFVSALAVVGYQGTLSIEHEDTAFPRLQGVEESAAVLRRALSAQRADIFT